MTTINQIPSDKLREVIEKMFPDTDGLEIDALASLQREACIKFINSEFVKDWYESQKQEADILTDKEITNYWKRKNCFGGYLEGLEHGSQWMRDKLIPRIISENDEAEIKNMHELIDILCADFSVGLNKRGCEEYLLPKLKKYTQYKQSKQV